MKRFLVIAMLCVSFAAAANAATKCQTVEIEVKDYVPVQKCTIVEKQVPVKVYKDVTKVVVVTEEELVFEEREINTKKKVMVEEEYTVDTIEKVLVEETIMKKVCKLVPKEITKESLQNCCGKSL